MTVKLAKTRRAMASMAFLSRIHTFSLRPAMGSLDDSLAHVATGIQGVLAMRALYWKKNVFAAFFSPFLAFAKAAASHQASAVFS